MTIVENINDIEKVCVSFDELSALQIYQTLALRNQVFVVEQNCIYQDLDGKDLLDGVLHLLFIKNNEVVAYSRLLPKGISFDSPSIGRIVVSPQHRGQNLGRAIIRASIQKIQQIWPRQGITIGAQVYLTSLYGEFGFEKISQEYLEDGLAHIDMHLAAT